MIGPDNDARKPMSEDELRAFAAAQINEIEKYRLCLKIRLGHDPLDDCSMNELCSQWIHSNSASFRRYWVNREKVPN